MSSSLGFLSLMIENTNCKNKTNKHFILKKTTFHLVIIFKLLVQKKLTTEHKKARPIFHSGCLAAIKIVYLLTNEDELVIETSLWSQKNFFLNYSHAITTFKLIFSCCKNVFFPFIINNSLLNIYSFQYT